MNVAQIVNLLCRRLAVGRRSAELNSVVSPICNRQGVYLFGRAALPDTRRMQFCDTADYESALRNGGAR